MFRNWTADCAALYDHWLEQIDAAESLGFDSLWVTEHHFRYFGGMMPSPSILLAAAAQRTKKMRLGAAVSILPMHNPLRIAEEFAMVDQLSGGRVLFGAGRGMHPTEYAVFGADWNNAQQRLPEALDVVTGRGRAMSSSGTASTINFRNSRFIRSPGNSPIRRSM